MRILLVDRSWTRRADTGDALIRAGSTVQTMSDGVEVLLSLTRHQEPEYDAIAISTDVGDGITGMDLIKGLHRTKAYRSTPMILYSPGERGSFTGKLRESVERVKKFPTVTFLERTNGMATIGRQMAALCAARV